MCFSATPAASPPSGKGGPGQGRCSGRDTQESQPEGSPCVYTASFFFQAGSDAGLPVGEARIPEGECGEDLVRPRKEWPRAGVG